jgi:uncharacterized protein (TIGR02996 family)
MSDDRSAGFLKDILANPDDDTPRLVFADWLDENGDPERAEFLRVQCRLARLPERDPGRKALEQRSGELLNGYQDVPLPRPRRKQTHQRVYNQERWKTPLPPWVNSSTFRRGFSATAFIDDANLLQFLTHPEELWRHTPVEGLRVSVSGIENDRPQIEQLLSLLAELQADLGRLRFLSLADRGMTDELALTFLLCPGFSGLTRLQLGESYLGDITLVGLANSAHLRSLVTLDCTGIFDDEGVSTRLSPAGVGALAGSPHLAGLRELVLTRNNVGDAGAAALARSPYLRLLERLEVYDSYLGNEGAAALADSPVLDGVRALGISSNICVWSPDYGTSADPDSDAALLALAKSRHLGNVEHLDLAFGAASDRALFTLLDSKKLPKLQRVEIRSTWSPEWADREERLRERYGERVVVVHLGN